MTGVNRRRIKPVVGKSVGSVWLSLGLSGLSHPPLKHVGIPVALELSVPERVALVEMGLFTSQELELKGKYATVRDAHLSEFTSEQASVLKKFNDCFSERLEG